MTFNSCYNVFHTIENIVKKGETAGIQDFLLFPQCFQEASRLSVVKPYRIVW